jgi:hypothetical protein
MESTATHTTRNFNKRGFTTSEAAEYIGRSPAWLRKKRLRGIDDPGDPGPRYLTPNHRSTIYLKEDLDAWLDKLSACAPAAAAA